MVAYANTIKGVINMERLLETKEMEELLGVTKNTLTKYIKKGMPVIKLSQTTNRYDKEAVLEWLKTRGEKR